MILIVAPGCDNVTWGGASISLQTPSARAAEPTAGPAAQPPGTEAEEATRPDEPSVLFAGTRAGSTATLVAVGELRRGALAPLGQASSGAAPGEGLVGEYLAPGRELVLFSDGSRVGRMTVDAVGVDERSCVSRPTAVGVVEMVPSADGASRFLALPAEHVRRRSFEAFTPLQHTYEQRLASLTMAREALPRVGATWPPSVLEARKDMQAFQLRDQPAPSIAATFLYGDTLAIARPFRNAYSLFVMATGEEGAIATDFVWYRPVNTEGKGAPRYLDHLDWNGDGSDEVLLEVLGADSRWFAALAKRNGSWVRAFEDACPAAAAGA